MALDFMAIVSNGTYPTPTPTAAARAAYAVSYGLLGVASSVVPSISRRVSWLSKFIRTRR